MAGETLATVVGNLTADPELRFTTAGIPVAGFTVASTPRTYDRERGQWVDGEPLFLRCSLWRQPAENAAGSLTKGMRIIVTGRLKQRTFDDNEGQRRTVVEMDAEDVAVSLTYATASVTKAYRPSGSGAAAPVPGQQPQQPSAETQPHPF
ncbi:single-stranded DNA-binding protein [Streptomyces sp. NBC_00289]|uniref:single-stranded DNA-binding protein n=1 Tax=Streptomyces sp. NBC_00289 TaxID=2975703 RepID=UPI0032551413